MYGYIYMILNKINGKKYIGQHKSMKFCYEDTYMGSGVALKRAKEKYGIENFEKLLVQYVETAEEADKQEIFWIDHYDTTNPEKGYNISKGGIGIRLEYSWNAGKKGVYSEETLQKMSESAKKRPPISEETKKKISKSMSGRKSYYRTKESIEKMRTSLKEGYKNGTIKRQTKKVQNIETKQIFDSVKEAAESINVCESAISLAIRRGNKSGGFHWGRI